MSDDYYAVLQVRDDADSEVIRLAYKALVRKHHPDVTSGDAQGDIMARINNAYAVLSDPERRSEYDKARRQLSLSKDPLREANSDQSHAYGTRKGALARVGIFVWLGATAVLLIALAAFVVPRLGNRPLRLEMSPIQWTPEGEGTISLRMTTDSPPARAIAFIRYRIANGATGVVEAFFERGRSDVSLYASRGSDRPVVDLTCLGWRSMVDPSVLGLRLVAQHSASDDAALAALAPHVYGQEVTFAVNPEHRNQEFLVVCTNDRQARETQEPRPKGWVARLQENAPPSFDALVVKDGTGRFITDCTVPIDYVNLSRSTAAELLSWDVVGDHQSEQTGKRYFDVKATLAIKDSRFYHKPCLVLASLKSDPSRRQLLAATDGLATLGLAGLDSPDRQDVAAIVVAPLNEAVVEEGKQAE